MVMTARDTEIKSGYKLIEVGVVPEDWEVHTLGDEIDQLEAGISVNSVDEEFHTYAHEQAILKTSSVSNGYFLPHENKKIAPKDIKRAKLNPRANSIIISRMNTPDLVGECGYVEEDYPNLFLPDRLWMTRFKRESKINVKWLSYLLTYRTYKLKMKLAATGTSDSMKNLSKDSLLSINIPFPTPNEQHAIATALSDVDALIASLDKLIAKKRNIKQAAIQQLLTGKMRLPGFSKELKQAYKQTEVGVIPEDWDVHMLGDEIDQLEAGVSVNSVDEEYPYEQAILKTSAVSNGYFLPHENKRIAPRDIKRAKLNPRIDTIIISRMNTLDLVGECGYVDKDYPNIFLPDRLWMTRFKRESKINVKWLSYLLNSKEYKIKIKLAATGTSGSMKNISKDSLLSINIPFPMPEEQTAIATVLSDMDAEIVALEQKRDKARAVKQGMMQELLTGKTRLL